MYDVEVMDKMTKQVLAGEEANLPDVYKEFTFEDALNLHFKVVPASALYERNAEQGTWTDRSKDDAFMKERVENGIDLRIVGVVQPSSDGAALMEGVGYLPALTGKLMEVAAESDIVKQQLANEADDVFTGESFESLQEGQGGQFDFESMFSVDEDALASAFSFDSSALEGGMRGVDLSGMDLSGMDAGSLQGLDVSDLDMSALSSTLSPEAIAGLMQGAPAPDLSGITVDATPEQQQAIAEAQGALMRGFMAYFAAHAAEFTDGSGRPDVQAAYLAYLATDEGKAAAAALQEASGAMYQAAVQAAVSEYMTTQFAPFLSQRLQDLMQQAAQVMMASMAQQMAAQMTAAANQMGTQLSTAINGQLSSQMNALSASLEDGFSVDSEAFAKAITFNMTQDDLTSLLMNYMNAEELTLDANLKKLGYATYDAPDSISIFPIDFAAKEHVLDIIDGYNRQMEDAGESDKAIRYSDLAGVLMSSVTSIVDAISMVLIAFVSISLVVSSIMIAIITYISVLERKKEIGILRAMGASKLNIANVFNAETIIEGLIAGMFAIALVYAVSVPVNAIVYASLDVPTVMLLPWDNALILIAISVGLTFVAGLIPSSMAASRDPVEALRSE